MNKLFKIYDNNKQIFEILVKLFDSNKYKIINLSEKMNLELFFVIMNNNVDISIELNMNLNGDFRDDYNYILKNEIIDLKKKFNKEINDLKEENKTISKELKEIKVVLSELNPADIAEILEEFPDNQRLLFFRLLSKENAAETFVELDPDTQEELIHGISDSELREVLDEIYIDDAVDIIEEMPATLVKRILKNTDSETRKSINALLKVLSAAAIAEVSPLNLEAIDSMPTLAFCTEPEKSVGESCSLFNMLFNMDRHFIVSPILEA